MITVAPGTPTANNLSLAKSLKSGTHHLLGNVGFQNLCGAYVLDKKRRRGPCSAAVRNARARGYECV